MARKSDFQVLEEIKAVEKQKLDTQSGTPEKVQYLWEEISRSDVDKRGLVRKAVLVIHLFLLARRNPEVLKNQDIRRLKELFYASLATAKVEPSTGGFSILFRDFHLALSQLLWKDCDWFSSSWQQSISFDLSGEFSTNHTATDMFAAGVRAFRLAHGEAAMIKFAQITPNDLDPRNAARLLLNKARLHRIRGEFAEVRTTLQRANEFCSDDHELGLEIFWERQLVAYCETKQVGPLFELISVKGSHRKTTYILESFLFALSNADGEIMSTVPTLKTFLNLKAIVPDECPLLYACTKSIFNCYRNEEPLMYRVDKLGESLSEVQNLEMLDQEILIWAAASVWTKRHNLEELASLCRLQYESLNMKASGGKTKDGMTIFSEIRV